MSEEKELECGGLACRTCPYEDDCGFHYEKDDHPSTCPRCNHAEVKHKQHEPYDRAMISVDWACLKCGFDWVEIYKFLEWRRDD